MKTYTLKAKTDSNGILRIEFPTDAVDTEYELVVVLQTTEQLPENGDSEIPRPGSGAYMAYMIEKLGGVDTGETIDASKSDDILNDEFADYIVKKKGMDDVLK